MPLSDWLLPQPQLVGGPVLTPFRSPSGTNMPGRPAVPPPQMTWGDVLNSLSNMENITGENQLRQAQTGQLGAQIALMQAAMQPAPPMFDGGNGSATSSMF